VVSTIDVLIYSALFMFTGLDDTMPIIFGKIEEVLTLFALGY